MTNTTSEKIAKLFKEAVEFKGNFSDIKVFNDVLRQGDAFYSLTDKEAFFALLGDYFPEDNQLVDIFKDLFDAELGIQKFSVASQRSNPRAIISFFIQNPKYSYHSASISKVYTAVNAWLVFFGSEPISTEWTQCPFCGSAVKNGACSMTGCKQPESNFYAAYGALSNMLARVNRGEDVADPPFFKKIKPGSEFDTSFVKPIDEARKRIADTIEEIGKKAVMRLREIESKIPLAAVGEEITYEGILKEIDSDADIKAARQLAGDKLKKEIARIADLIIAKKAEEDAIKQRYKLTEKYIEMVSEMSAAQIALFELLRDPSHEHSALVRAAEALEKMYKTLVAEKNRGSVPFSDSDKEFLARYPKAVRSLINGYIKEREEIDRERAKRKEELSARASQLDRLFESEFSGYLDALYASVLEGGVDKDAVDGHKRAYIAAALERKTIDAALAEADSGVAECYEALRQKYEKKLPEN